jgi:fused signal recognition particle receptor
MEQQEKKGFFRGLINKITGADAPAAKDIAVENEESSQPVQTGAPEAAAATIVAPPAEKPSFFERLKSGLKKPRTDWWGGLTPWCSARRRLMPTRWRSWKKF